MSEKLELTLGSAVADDDRPRPAPKDTSGCIEGTLSAAEAGRGRVALLEMVDLASASAALEAAAAMAARRGMRVLRAAGRTTESGYPFGVAIQLMDSVWRADAGGNSSPFAGAGHTAGDLLSGVIDADIAEDSGTWFPVIRSMMWVIRRLATAPAQDERCSGLAILVDVLHLADTPSVRFLAYVAARIEDLPVALVLAMRPDEENGDPALVLLRAASGDAILPLGPRVQGAPDTSPAREAVQPSAALGTSPGKLAAVERVLADPQPEAASRPPQTSNARDVVQTADLAQLAMRGSLSGERRSHVRDFAQRAWESGTLMAEAQSKPWVTVHMARSLLVVDELELADQILSDPRKATLDQSDAAARAGAAEARSWILFHQGKLSAALVEAGRGRDGAAVSDDISQSLDAVVAACLVHSGQLEKAGAALMVLDSSPSLHGRSLPLLLEARGQLRLAERRPGDALHDALEARRLSSAGDHPSAGPAAWRCIAARAHLARGELPAARRLAGEELEVARICDVPRRTIGALRVLALASGGDAPIDLLTRAVRLGDDQPPRLEYLYALVDLGSALRRANRRKAARDVLTRAFGLADQLGAKGPAERAREELAASAGRRSAPTGIGRAALTPSERRVATLAAGGRTTREIAADLVVTPKTVEFHLRHIYRKLEIPSSRAELTRAVLAGGESDGALDAAQA